MSTIDYARMTRICTRLQELAAEPELKPVVKGLYEDRVSGAVAAFIAADAEISAAESAARKESREAFEALARMDQPYREARAVLVAYHPDTTLPETLKSQRTDTDRKNALERLIDLLDDHAGATWADTLLAGELGQNATNVIQELNEAVNSNAALASARDARAQAYGPAYERYLAFKNVVRNTYGSSSPQYRRIHLRSSGAPADEPKV